MGDGDKRSDLFNAEESAMEGMTPDFWASQAQPEERLYVNGVPIHRLFGGKAEKVDDKGAKKKKAINALKKNEDGATDKPNMSGTGGDENSSLGDKEVSIAREFGRYKNAVKGVKEIQSGQVGKGFGRLKKGGPLFVILGILAMFGGASFLGQMSMPFSLLAQLQDKFDSISVSQTFRTKSFFKFQTTNNGRNYSLVKVGFFSPAKFEISAKQKMKLEGSDGKIKVIDDIGNGRQGLLYNGKVIVADASDAVNGRVTLDSMFESDVSFRDLYTERTRTWRGSVAAWFDDPAAETLKLMGVSRNKLKNAGDQDSENSVKQKISEDADQEFEGKYKATNEADGEVVDDKTGKVTGSDPNEPTVKGDTTTESISLNKNSSKVEIGNQLSKIGDVLNVANTGINFVCGVMEIATAFKALIIGYQAMQNLAIVTNFLEGINRAQAGDDDKNLVHQLGNLLMQKATSTYEVTDYNSVKRNGDKYEGDTTTLSLTGSAMEASPMQYLFGGQMPDMSDPSVQSFQPSAMINRALNKVFDTQFDFATSIDLSEATSVDAYRSCTIARLATSAGLATLQILLWLFPPAGAAGSTVTSVAKTALKAAISIAFSVIAAFAIPYFGQMLARQAFKDVVGIDLGTIMPTTTNKYMGDMHIGSGLGDKMSLLMYRNAQDKVIAEKAQYERDTHSPFDITSKYTFLGSLATQLIPLASQMSSLNGAISSFGALFSKSVTSLIPHSSAISNAVDIAAIEERTKEYCPELYDIGALGDEECNVYKVTDMSTIDVDPAANTEEVYDMGDNLEPAPESGDGAPKINNKSKLAKYLIFCSQRQSPWGITDQNIATKVAPLDSSNYIDNVGVSAATDTVVGMIPVVGDIVDVVNNEKKVKNMGWITGQSCVTNNSNSEAVGGEAVTWDEAKKYQRFIEDQRLAEQMGLVKESAVTEFLTEYYEENPIDTSFEGTLARYSGLTKDNVIALLDYVEVQSFIAEYEPANLLPYSQEEGNEDPIKIDDGIIIEESPIIIAQYYYYESRRDYSIC